MYPFDGDFVIFVWLCPAQDPLRWLKVASLLPGKSHEDVRHRYQRLIYDVHKIENAMPV